MDAHDLCYCQEPCRTPQIPDAADYKGQEASFAVVLVTADSQFRIKDTEWIFLNIARMASIMSLHRLGG